MSVIDLLEERGFIKQFSHEEEIRELLENESVTFYIGFDPTADSLHVGHFIQLMVMMHLQKAGHKPIALLGGGTAVIGDPSGRTDMRKMLTMEEIDRNIKAFKVQMSKFIDFSEGKAIMENNANWLLKLNYVEFIRDIGIHFSVNKMLTAECFKQRLEKGLSFLEFNYMLMQGYDFLELNKRYGCILQVGGDDQWSNILAGADLIRRKERKNAFALTMTLLTNSEGKKMGKTEKGALWLDPNKTSPFEFYQYWRNVDDKDVEKCLALLTLIPMEEVRRLGSLEGKEINSAKEVLAYEVTKLIHGEEEAEKCQNAARALFSGDGDLKNAPTIEIASDDLNLTLLDILCNNKIIPSKSEGKRLVNQGGLHVNNEKISDITYKLKDEDFNEGEVLIKRGKKNYNRIILKG